MSLIRGVTRLMMSSELVDATVDRLRLRLCSMLRESSLAHLLGLRMDESFRDSISAIRNAPRHASMPFTSADSDEICIQHSHKCDLSEGEDDRPGSVIATCPVTSHLVHQMSAVVVRDMLHDW